MAQLSRIGLALGFLVFASAIGSMAANGWYKLKEQDGVCVIANDNVLMGISWNNAEVELIMSNMQPRDGSRAIYVDGVHIGRTKYMGDGILTLEKTLADNVIIKMFIEGRQVGSQWQSKSLMGFHDAYRQCTFDENSSASIGPEQEETGSVETAPAPVNQCTTGPIETQARCQCESQGFTVGSQEFLVCFQSVLARMHRQEQNEADAVARQQQAVEAERQMRRQAEINRQERRRQAVGAILRGIGMGLVQQSAPPPVVAPSPQRCTSRWIGDGLVTNCF